MQFAEKVFDNSDVLKINVNKKDLGLMEKLAYNNATDIVMERLFGNEHSLLKKYNLQVGS